MGHFGFSYIGFLFLLMLLIPNLIFIKNLPQGYDSAHESKVLLAFEKVGQALVTGSALVFSDFNLHGPIAWNLWLIAAFAIMLLYEGWWFRYFRSEKTLKNFYSSFCGIPVAGASLPVIAFLLLGIYGKVIWLIASAIILGIGHIGIHLRHRGEKRDSY